MFWRSSSLATPMFTSCLTALLMVVTLSMQSTHAQDKLRVYLGTYTGPKSQGIYVCEMDLKQGTLSEPKLAGETSSPSFLAFHPSQKFLFAVNESDAKLSAFAMDRSTGKLTFLNSQPSQGAAPCHLSVDAAGKNVLAANYTGGSCISIPILADGKLGDTASFQQHQGPRKHGHAIHLDKANKFAFCCDLGLDQVIIYAFDSATGKLAPHAAFNAPKGTGPRHFAWSPDARRAFVNGETNMTLLVCDYDAEKGQLTQTQVLSTLPADVVAKGGSTAETVVHPSGKFVYVSNRDPYNSIAIFTVDPSNGQLKAAGHYSEAIKTPRNFAIEPTGQFMLVANQSADNVLVFRINQTTGQLTPTGSSISVGSPVCVRFTSL